MKYVSVLALLIAGVIHLLPLQGVLGTGNLARLYGVAVSDPNTAILLQHRALLFGVLGVLMLMAIPVLALAASGTQADFANGTRAIMSHVKRRDFTIFFMDFIHTHRWHDYPIV